MPRQINTGGMKMQSNIDLVHAILVGSGEINMPHCEKTAAASLAGNIKRPLHRLQLVYLPQTTSNAACLSCLLARWSSALTELLWGHEATKGLFFSLKLGNDFCKGWKHYQSPLHGESNHLGGCGSSLSVRVFVCLCGIGRQSAALYLHFSGQRKFCLGSCKRMQSQAATWYYCTERIWGEDVVCKHKHISPWVFMCEIGSGWK